MSKKPNEVLAVTAKVVAEQTGCPERWASEMITATLTAFQGADSAKLIDLARDVVQHRLDHPGAGLPMSEHARLVAAVEREPMIHLAIALAARLCLMRSDGR